MVTLLTMSFDENSMCAARHAVRDEARRRGLTSERLDNFLTAVNESIGNAVEHGGGQGWLTLWWADDDLFCEVRDAGPGIPARTLDQACLPPPSVPGGRGIWLMRRLADSAVFSTGPDGTAVLLRIGVAPPAPPGCHAQRCRPGWVLNTDGACPARHQQPPDAELGSE
ncbi:ATP-binding protein [Nonomuraea gerenzanensis]|uniref:Putative regulator of sigma factor n=1 Tax=Nonomuraea gerenzanensis TaxID=93944 RepID=A0A1M4EME0_9ACTN|nr:ATP-binding protein [Nonomuraea gerenzanensis]UBU11521.1 ATP-binding protein [Nonomuraea gerenzanensis]SBP00010.1 Putative regulator of sigma factor [Nonomuraea gerenzanensis]